MKTEVEMQGVEFNNPYTSKLKLITDGYLKGWVVAKHPDGQWVTLFNTQASQANHLADADKMIGEKRFTIEEVEKIIQDVIRADDLIVECPNTSYLVLHWTNWQQKKKELMDELE